MPSKRIPVYFDEFEFVEIYVRVGTEVGAVTQAIRGRYGRNYGSLEVFDENVWEVCISGELLEQLQYRFTFVTIGLFVFLLLLYYCSSTLILISTRKNGKARRLIHPLDQLLKSS